MRRILIDNRDDGIQGVTFGMPWKRDSSCFNFNMPEEVVTVDHIDIIDNENVETLVIGCPLDSYEFISKMTNLTQLYIYNAETIENLGFIKNLNKLNQLYISAYKIGSISDLLELLNKKVKIISNDKNLHNLITYGLDCICLNTACDIPADGFKACTRYTFELIINNRRLKR